MRTIQAEIVVNIAKTMKSVDIEGTRGRAGNRDRAGNNRGGAGSRDMTDNTGSKNFSI